jgi:hypothetical protein
VCARPALVDSGTEGGWTQLLSAARGCVPRSPADPSSLRLQPADLWPLQACWHVCSTSSLPVILAVILNCLRHCHTRRHPTWRGAPEKPLTSSVSNAEPSAPVGAPDIFSPLPFRAHAADGCTANPVPDTLHSAGNCPSSVLHPIGLHTVLQLFALLLGLTLQLRALTQRVDNSERL